LFEEGTGDYSLQITVPNRKYALICGALKFGISSSNSNLILDTLTGLMTVKTPAGIFWGREDVTITISNQVKTLTASFGIQVFDCLNAKISP
jgi:hypothetical protein